MRSRATGAGSIHVGTDGRFHARIYLRDGRRVSWRRITRAQAETALAEMIALHAGELGVLTRKRATGYYAGDERRARPPRSGVTTKVRWAVFQRDGFRCVYCGASAAESRLVVDHVLPIAKGGDDGMDNLATACRDCNLGKADKALSDGQN